MSSDEEEYFYSDDDTQEIDKIDLTEESKSNDDTTIEDMPEYRHITEINMYEFMIWANEHRDKSVSLDHFNMILQSKLHDWIEKNNITWQYALTLVTDIISNQTNIDSHFDISSNLNEVVEKNEDLKNVNNVENKEDSGEKINLKPTSIEERRKLFAAAAEKRASKRF